MAEHLILFKTDMVESINAGIKNQTRRLITERNSRSTSKLHVSVRVLLIGVVNHRAISKIMIKAQSQIFQCRQGVLI